MFNIIKTFIVNKIKNHMLKILNDVGFKNLRFWSTGLSKPRFPLVSLTLSALSSAKGIEIMYAHPIRRENILRKGTVHYVSGK
jgi:hypothetical protein